MTRRYHDDVLLRELDESQLDLNLYVHDLLWNVVFYSESERLVGNEVRGLGGSALHLDAELG